MINRLKYILPVALFFAVGGMGNLCAQELVVDVTQWGAKPDDGKDDTKALRKAVEYACDHPGTTLYLPPGKYLLKDKEALKLEQEVMQGKMGANPEKVVYTPYYPYVKGLNFDGAKHVTVKADRAVLMCEGWMEPVSLNRCEHVAIEGLSIDYVRKPFVSGEVVEIKPSCFEVQFSAGKRVTDEMPLTRMTFWEKDKNRLYPEPIYFPKRELLGNNRVRFHHAIPDYLLGSDVTVLNSLHFRPAILIYASEDTRLSDVTIHAQPGMGVVGFDSKDILLERLSVVPSKGYYLSTNTDATHFACCTGTLHFVGCNFQGQGDDATNVHGYYQTILEHHANKARIQVNATTYTHAQVADVPRVGDTLELVEKKTLKPIKSYIVREAKHHNPETSVEVTLSENLPENSSAYYLMNISKLPELIFENSVINSHLARGILVKTKKARIVNNVFRACSGTAIHIGAEANWHEGTHSRDVFVQNNVMIGCGKGAGSQAGAAGIAVIIEAQDTKDSYLHEHVCLENNMIMGEGNPCGIYVGNSKNIILKDNKILNCKKDYIFHSVDQISDEQK